MKLNIEDIPTASVADVKIYEMAKMILASLIVIIGLVYLLCYKKTKKIQKSVKEIKVIHQPQHQRVHIPNQLNRISSTQRYKFSLDQDYGNEDQSVDESRQEQQELISMLRDDHLVHRQQVYSIKQAKQNFLANLKCRPVQKLIYLDQNDYKERQNRKAKLQQNQMILRQKQQLKHKKELAPKQKVHTKSDQTKLTKPQKEEKKVTLCQRTVFAVNKEQPTQKVQAKVEQKTQPQRQLDFKNISLGLSTQISKKQQIQPTQAQKPAFPIFQPQTKPAQSSQSLFGGLTGQQPQPSLFGSSLTQPIQNVVPQKPAEQKKDQPLNLGQTSIPANLSTTLFSQPLNNQPQSVLPSQPQQASTVPSGPVLPPLQQAPPSQAVLPSSTRISSLSKTDYLQKLIDYSNKAKQQCQLKKTKINNFGRSISNFKQIYETALDFINTINLGDAKQMQTLGCVIFDFLLNKTIPVWPKQEGWEMFPPRSKNQTKWKISISTYVLKLNLYRIMGYETLWLIVFGKLLSLLDFTWKRTEQIKKSNTAYKQLDLVKNNYFSLLKQDDMAPKYFTRLDLITYFLFCMTTFDPQLVSQYLCQTAGQDPSTLEQIKKYKYKWSYNYFWILVQTILQNKAKTYFKPVVYMNMLSSMYLQIRRNKMNSTEFEDFDHLRKFILKQAIEYTTPRALQQNAQIQALADLQEETRDFKFDGEDFLGQLETFNFYFKEKEAEYRKATDRKGFQEFEKRCSVFSYFKSGS